MSKVNRSTYQKVVEENRRLLADIEILTAEGISLEERVLCSVKWQEKFRKEKEFSEAMRQAARQYIKDHADELPEFLTKGLNEQEETE